MVKKWVYSQVILSEKDFTDPFLHHYLDHIGSQNYELVSVTPVTKRRLFKKYTEYVCLFKKQVDYAD